MVARFGFLFAASIVIGVAIASAVEWLRVKYQAWQLIEETDMVLNYVQRY